MSRSDAAYEQLRRDLLDGRWLPGTTLSTYALAEELGMSRTPVIDALKRLEADGLVEIVPQVGCVVVQRTTKEVVDTLKIRSVLEGLAAEAAAERITEHELRSLEAVLREGEDAARRGDADGYEEANRAFHRGIVKASQIPQLEKTLSSVWLLNRYQLASVRFLGSRLRQSVREHRAILAAIKRHDPAGARQLLEGHLRRSAADFAEFADAADKGREAKLA